MTVPLLDLRAQYESIGDELDRALRSVVESQAFIMGAPVKELERVISEYVGVSHGQAGGHQPELILPRTGQPAQTASGL